MTHWQIPEWVWPIATFVAYLARSPLPEIVRYCWKGKPMSDTTVITADMTTFATSLVSAVVSTHDAEARKAAVVAAVDANKDKLATDFGASPLEVAALNWVSSDANEEHLYDAFDTVAEELVHQVAEGFLDKIVPTLKAALHLG